MSAPPFNPPDVAGMIGLGGRGRKRGSSMLDALQNRRQQELDALRLQEAQRQQVNQARNQALDLAKMGVKPESAAQITNADPAFLDVLKTVSKTVKEQEKAAKQQQFQQQELPAARSTVASANLAPGDPRLQSALVALNERFSPDQLRMIESEAAGVSGGVREERQAQSQAERRRADLQVDTAGRREERVLRTRARLAKQLESLDPAKAARERFEIESNLNATAVKQSDSFLTVADAHDKIVGVLENPDSPAAMQAAIIAFNKVLDPESVVRESEFGRTFSFQSLENRFKSFLERQQQGTVNEEVLRDLLEATDRLALAAAKTQKKRESQFTRRAKEMELSVDNVLPPQRAGSLSSRIKERGVGKLPSRNIPNPQGGGASPGGVQAGQTIRLPSGTLTLER